MPEVSEDLGADQSLESPNVQPITQEGNDSENQHFAGPLSAGNSLLPATVPSTTQQENVLGHKHSKAIPIRVRLPNMVPKAQRKWEYEAITPADAFNNPAAAAIAEQGLLERQCEAIPAGQYVNKLRPLSSNSDSSCQIAYFNPQGFLTRRRLGHDQTGIKRRRRLATAIHSIRTGAEQHEPSWPSQGIQHPG